MCICMYVCIYIYIYIYTIHNNTTYKTNNQQITKHQVLITAPLPEHMTRSFHALGWGDLWGNHLLTGGTSEGTS